MRLELTPRSEGVPVVCCIVPQRSRRYRSVLINVISDFRENFRSTICRPREDLFKMTQPPRVLPARREEIGAAGEPLTLQKS
ncbi:hypothetical protein K443DRAFT_620316 [Laccaria amethystina LaAM-08-1]|uniref:Uncharacterized protein n=1 Tax=Laccaria amethystina LaAM-08-1 TaxID=1095629 RepID=A0A0C9XQU4_9AGAR|nr:hypothetical protein K443DRAFT_620316 [Laccaria amethystina LaAM-08-1]